MSFCAISIVYYKEYCFRKSFSRIATLNKQFIDVQHKVYKSQKYFLLGRTYMLFLVASVEDVLTLSLNEGMLRLDRHHMLVGKGSFVGSCHNYTFAVNNIALVRNVIRETDGKHYNFCFHILLH